jgi:hypothetical protein
LAFISEAEAVQQQQWNGKEDHWEADFLYNDSPLASECWWSDEDTCERKCDDVSQAEERVLSTEDTFVFEDKILLFLSSRR